MEIYETIMLLLLIVLGNLLGWLFTESSEYNIVKHIPQLDKKPFNCRPCLTFHFVWIMSALVALAVGSLRLFIIGFLMAFINYIALYLLNQLRIDD